MKRHPSAGLILGLGLLGGFAAASRAADAPGYHIVKKTVLGGEGGWDYLTADAAAHRVYITRGDRVMVVDAASHKLISTLPETGRIHGVALAPEFGRGFVTNGQDNTVTIFDTKTGKALGSAPVGEGPDGIIYDPATKRVFSFNGRANNATAIDAATGKAVGSVTLGGRPEFAAADGRGMVFVNLEDKSEVAAFDAKTLKVVKHWSIAPGEGPSGLAIDAKHRRLFSVCDGKMIVSDADAGKVVATVPIGDGPDAAGFDPKTQMAFSSNGDGTLTVVHEDTPNTYTVLENASTQAGARTMTLDTRTHHVFLVTATPDTSPAPAGSNPRRRRYVTGSFTLLELAPGKAMGR